MKIERIKKGSWGKVVAFFDLSIQGVTIKGFKLVEGSNGLFVGSPSKEDKNNEYQDIVWIEKEVRNKITELATKSYNSDSEAGINQTSGSDIEVPF